MLSFVLRSSTKEGLRGLRLAITQADEELIITAPNDLCCAQNRRGLSFGSVRLPHSTWNAARASSSTKACGLI